MVGTFDLFSQNVTLTDNGSSVTLANGIISATVDKNNGNCTDLRRIGGSNLLANGGKLYFDANGSISNAASAYFNFSPDAYIVVTNTTERAEIALTDLNLTGFRATLHYCLRSGDSGFYVFAVYRHDGASPVSMLEQSRTVLRCDPNVFVYAYGSPDKIGQMISPSLLSASLPTISDATYKLPMVSSYTNETGFDEDNFPVYTKYDWAEYTENHTIEGLTSETVGLWMLFGGREYFNGGPTRANLILHGTETTPLLLWDFHALHFGGSKINKNQGEAWTKLYGPAFVYVNTGANRDALWADALNRAALEESSWPHEWMTDTNYPVARGVVKGKLHVLGESCSNALIVLAQPGTNWNMQSDNYQFWTRASADGQFTIPDVRSGSYSLFARVPGVVGEFETAGVIVTSNLTNDVGTLEWNPVRRTQRLWRIGTPDISAGEFRFGDQMRQFGLWWRYMEEQGTNDLVYRIGSSTPANWYYAQSVVAMDDGSWFSPNWKVQFVLSNLPPAPVVLTIDLAGGNSGTLLTTVNGTSLANISIWNDSAVTRSATRSGAPRHHELSFGPSLLQVGTNVITFALSKSSNWSGTKPVNPNRSVMWDCVQLEAGPLITQITPRIDSIAALISGDIVLRGSGGFPNGTFHLLSSDNFAQLAPWPVVLTGQFGATGGFVVTNSVNSSGERFYRLLVP